MEMVARYGCTQQDNDRASWVELEDNARARPVQSENPDGGSEAPGPPLAARAGPQGQARAACCFKLQGFQIPAVF